MSTQPVLASLFLIILDIIHVLKIIYVDIAIHIINSIRFYFLGANDAAVLSTYFRGKTVLITGASSGLGEALALKVAQTSATGKACLCNVSDSLY
jgi:FlaA1/EpsC-like NDP-sugar epimerase